MTVLYESLDRQGHAQKKWKISLKTTKLPSVDEDEMITNPITATKWYLAVHFFCLKSQIFMFLFFLGLVTRLHLFTMCVCACACPPHVLQSL